MPNGSLFWKIVDTLEPAPQQAQIVIGLSRQAGQSGKLLNIGKILDEVLGGPQAEGGQAEAVLVLATSPRTRQEAVMRLSELGVSQLHAIYPQAAAGQAGGRGREPATDTAEGA